MPKPKSAPKPQTKKADKDYKHPPRQRKEWRETKRRQRAGGVQSQQMDMALDGPMDGSLDETTDTGPVPVHADVQEVVQGAVQAQDMDTRVDMPMDKPVDTRAQPVQADVLPAVQAPVQADPVDRPKSAAPPAAAITAASPAEPAAVPVHDRVPPLRKSLAGSVMGAICSAGFLGLCWAQYANLRGPLGHMKPEPLAWWGTSGDAMAFGMVVGEGILGIVLGCALGVEDHMEPVNVMPDKRRKVYATVLGVALVGFAIGEAGLALIGELQGEQRNIEAARDKADQSGKADQGERPTAVAAVASGVGAHPQTMTSAVTAAGDADVKTLTKAHDLRVGDEEDAEKRATKVNRKLRLVNLAVLVWVALMLAMAVGLCGVVVGSFVSSVLAIPAGILAAIGAGIAWCANRRRRPAEAPAAAPAPPPSDKGGALVPVPAIAPAEALPTRESMWSRVTRWPLVARLLGRRQPARGAAA